VQEADQATSGRQARLVRVLLDGMAVLAAILIAFGLDAWWGSRAEQARTEALLSALEGEWEAELKTLDSIIPELARNRSAFAAEVEAHRTDQVGVTPDSAAALMQRHRYRTYTPRVAALDALLSTDLDKIGDRALRSAVAEWPGVLESAEPQDAALREIGLISLRRELSRVAESLELPWSEETGAGYPWGIPLEKLAPAAIADPEVAILYRHVSTVVYSYRQQLIGIRETLVRNLTFLRQR